MLITSRMTARTSQTSKTVRGWSSSTNITGAFALQFSETKVKPCKSSGKVVYFGSLLAESYVQILMVDLKIEQRCG